MGDTQTQASTVIQATDRLKCTLSTEDKVQLGAEQADKLNELDELKSRLDEFKSDIVKQQKKAAGRIARISETIRNGYEYREVPVEVTTDYAQAIVTKKRLDSGEVYETRPLTPSESQATLAIGKESPLDTVAQVERKASKRPGRRS